MNSPLPLPDVEEISVIELINYYVLRYPMFALLLLAISHSGDDIALAH